MAKGDEGADADLHAGMQGVLIESLYTKINLAFTLLKSAEIEYKTDPNHQEIAFKKPRRRWIPSAYSKDGLRT
jgi:hypothetical protein